MRTARAFTLIELLVVITIIAALAGMVMSAGIMLRNRGIKETAKSLVISVSAAIAGHQRQFGNEALGGDHFARHFLFDLDQDGELDGRPASDFDAAGQALATTLDYGGFLEETGFSLQGISVNPEGQVRDPYGFELRIAYATDQYGPEGIGVWSVGPDGTSGTSDDITSWGGTR